MTLMLSLCYSDGSVVKYLSFFSIFFSTNDCKIPWNHKSSDSIICYNPFFLHRLDLTCLLKQVIGYTECPVCLRHSRHVFLRNESIVRGMDGCIYNSFVFVELCYIFIQFAALETLLLGNIYVLDKFSKICNIYRLKRR